VEKLHRASETSEPSPADILKGKFARERKGGEKNAEFKKKGRRILKETPRQIAYKRPKGDKWGGKNIKESAPRNPRLVVIN